MNLKNWLAAYLQNSKKIRQSFNNPLKKMENLEKKDELERTFYDEEALPYLNDFKDEVFLYDPDEEMPQSHKYFYSQLKDIKGKRILDVGCGYGFTSVNLAKLGATIQSIDISPRMIELTQRNARLNKVEDKINAQIMSAQDMTFDDDTFDHVVGFGVLHHLNLELAGKEISRVLKHGGGGLLSNQESPSGF